MGPFWNLAALAMAVAITLALVVAASARVAAANSVECNPKVVCSAVHAENKDLLAQLRSMKKLEKESPRAELRETISACGRERNRLSGDLERRTQEFLRAGTELHEERARANALSKELEVLRDELQSTHEEKDTCRQSEYVGAEKRSQVRSCKQEQTRLV